MPPDDLLVQATKLYLGDIPRAMKDDGFCVWQILTCYQRMAEGNGPDLTGTDTGEASKQSTIGDGDKISRKKLEDAVNLGLKAYGLWRQENDKTSTPGAYGLTARQLSCLDTVNGWIESLETTMNQQEHRRLRKITCDLVITATLRLRGEGSTDRYKGAYQSVVDEFCGDEATILSEDWKSTLASLASGDTSVVDEMMAMVGDLSLQPDTSDVAFPESPASSDGSYDCQYRFRCILRQRTNRCSLSLLVLIRFSRLS
jgi:hypothetical protein